MHIQRLLRDVIDFVYPGRCAGCDRACETSGSFCKACADELDEIAAAPTCKWCASPLADANAPCPYCWQRSFHPYDKIVAMGVYRDGLKQLIQQMKYHHRWTLAEVLADRLFAEERVKGLLTEANCLVAVPLHWSRQIGRGYNQAAVLAQRMHRICGVKVVRPIVRIRRTQTQTAIHAHDRRAANLRNAFGLIDAASVRDQHVVVIDDVMTTVATLKAVARAILPAQPRSLCAIVLAVADPRRRDFQTI